MMFDIKQGDCLELLKAVKDNTFDMVFTSPPYADQRKSTYGGVDSKIYVDWFLPIAAEIKRTMKPTGSFFLNIKPHSHAGERDLYVFELVIAIKREIGMLFVDEYCWTKNAFPGNHQGRFKNGFEPVYHFTKSNPNQIIFHPLACGTPAKPESIKRGFRKRTVKPKNDSGMTAMDGKSLQRLRMARPDNVINVNNVSNQHTDKQKHPATFPVGLVDFFVQSFTNENAMVLDPFGGIFTTGLSCIKHNRNFTGFELKEKFFNIGESRMTKAYKLNAHGQTTLAIETDGAK